LAGSGVSGELDCGQADSRAGGGSGGVLYLDKLPRRGDHGGDGWPGVEGGSTLAQDAEHGLDGVLPGFGCWSLLYHLGRLAGMIADQQGEDDGLAAIEQACTVPR